MAGPTSRTGAGAPLVVPAKLIVPGLRPETVSRTRLTRLVERNGGRPLTVVTAPAGYGKTTALVEWLSSGDRACAWVSIDERDNDPHRLCAHVVAALDLARPDAMDDVQRALAAGSDLLDAVVPRVVAALGEEDDELVLVLDDYHLVEEEACHQLVMALIDAEPPGLRLVVAGRTRPSLRLARRQAAGTVVEIGLEQLRFRSDEAERLLNGSLALGLEADQIGAIDDRVHGWAAGLSLVAASLQGRPDREDFLEAFTASRREVANYLIEEVLDATDRRLRDFLCRTSILSRLSPQLCEAVLEDSSARESLAEVRSSNLFVTELHGDPDGEWLVYQDLFRELLQRDLQERSPELVPLLHRRAAAWFAANGAPSEAIHHAISAGHGELAAALLHESWRELLAERRYVEVRQTIAQLPSERGDYADFCEALDTMCMALEGADLRRVAQRLDKLEAARDSPGVPDMVDQLRVSPYYGNVGQAVEAGRQLWDRYAREPDKRAFMAGQFGVVLWFAGRRDEARELLEPLVGEIERWAGRSWALSTLALSASDDGELELAERHAIDAVELAEASGAEAALESHLAYLALGEALRRRGALSEAELQLNHAGRLTGKLPGSLYHALTLVFQAQLAVASRNRRRARDWAAAARRIVNRYPDVGVLGERLAAVEEALRRRSDDALLGSKPTPAELRLLELLPTDLTFKEIASQHLYVSIHTVTSHARRLYRRLGARTREEAVVAARERGLL